MKKILMLVVTSFCFFTAACLEKKVYQNEIMIEAPYAFATPSQAKTGAAFMLIRNGTADDDALIGAESSVAEITEIHENLIDPDDGMMMMRKIKSIALPAQSLVELKPDGYHVMFIKMNQPLTLGSSVSVKLIFEKAGERIIDIPVIAAGTKPESGHSH